MANGEVEKNRHFILEGVTETEAYRYPGGGGGDGSNVPERNRAEHAAHLSKVAGACPARQRRTHGKSSVCSLSLASESGSLRGITTRGFRLIMKPLGLVRFLTTPRSMARFRILWT